ncbi:MAG: primosomal protein N' [Bacillota bacterium]|nr:primosomal protein N' [Bacillota bacterium]
MKVAKIAVSAATYWLDRPYDYLIPEKFENAAVPGVRVTVPFSRGNRRSEGVILGVSDHSEYDRLKAIESVLDAAPVLSTEQIKLAMWMHDRFFCTVYDAVKTILPAGLWFKADGSRRANDKTVEMVELAIPVEDAMEIALQKKRKAPMQSAILDLLCTTGRVSAGDVLEFVGATRQSLKALINAELVSVDYEEVFRRPEIWNDETIAPPTLNDAQNKAFCGLKELLGRSNAEAALLFGVTGSGKTSVYIHLISEALNHGKTAILLVPEIALTPQMLATFSEYFGNNIAVLHSSLGVGERYDEWKRVKNGDAKLIIGTRSAVFAPNENLGLIIIDEEQEDSYKSENSPRYHARDIAKYRCAKSNALLLMGSATPDIESRYAAETGKYSYFELAERYNDMTLPKVSIVDMKRELRRGNGGNLSIMLRNELSENISRGEQSILFINRRGAHKLISCGECGYIYKCPRCSVSLTYHSVNRKLICHYCGYSRKPDEECPDCGGKLTSVGAGTQLIEEELSELFPDVEVLRMDADTVRKAGSHDVLLDRFVNEKIPIMVGTQMVTKGLNFENVTLIGVISADQSLYCSDYRAGERTFSLITQVVGRSGRGSKPGRAVIQTFTPQNEIILQAAAQDYDSFFESEIQLRKLQQTPPFSDIISITATGLNEDQVVRCCVDIRNILTASLKHRSDARVLGPAPLVVVKVNNRYRYRINIDCKADAEIRKIVSAILIKCNSDGKYKGVSIFADNNPAD